MDPIAVFRVLLKENVCLQKKMTDREIMDRKDRSKVIFSLSTNIIIAISLSTATARI